jgi:hypothetical protein
LTSLTEKADDPAKLERGILYRTSSTMPELRRLEPVTA